MEYLIFRGQFLFARSCQRPNAREWIKNNIDVSGQTECRQKRQEGSEVATDDLIKKREEKSTEKKEKKRGNGTSWLFLEELREKWYWCSSMIVEDSQMVQMCSGSILTKWRSFVLTGANVKWDLICSLNRSVFKSRNYDDSARDFFRSSAGPSTHRSLCPFVGRSVML